MKRTAAKLATKSSWFLEEHDRRHVAGCGSESLAPVAPEASADRSQPTRAPASGLRRLLAGILLVMGLGAVSAVPAHANNAPTGLPTISGVPGVGETLTASAAGIADADGVTGAAFAWQWVANDGTADTGIAGATAAAYTLTSAEVGKTIKVRVTFTDDGGTEETLVSEATVAVKPPLTAIFSSVPESHDGSTGFTLDLHFSEGLPLSFRTLRDTALEASGGEVRRARRLAKGSNIGWRITVQPDTSGDVTVALPARACDATGAICTADDRALSEAVSATVPGPASQPREVSISAAGNSTSRNVTPSSNTVTEGTAAVFTLTRTGSLTSALTVTVDVSETGTMLKGTPATTVTFGVGSATAELSVETEDDEVAESASVVTAALAAGSGYSMDSGASSATVTVEDDDAAPVVTTASPIVAPENGVSIATLTATDDDTTVADLVWSIAGGADQNKFTLSTSGVLAFQAAKDFEAPDDANGDGDYEVMVRVTDGANPVETALTIRLSDVDEAAPVLSSASVADRLLTLTFDESLDGGSTPGSGAFVVKIDGVPHVEAISSVSVNGSTVSLALSYSLSPWYGTYGTAVRVSYTAPTGANANPLQDAAGNPVAGFSDQAVTIIATPGQNTPSMGLPSISGTAQVGATLTASASDIADVDGLTNATFAWQWIANDGTSDADIAGATAETYALTSAEEGKTIKVRATFTDDGGTEETLLSAATAAVAAEDEDLPTLLWTPTLTIEARNGWRGYSTLAQLDLGAVSESSFAYGSGAPYPLLVLAANANGVIFQVPSRGEESLSELILEWVGATLPLSAAVRVGSTFTWGQTWLDANAASLNASAYATTLPDGGTGTVCLRTSDQTCPSTTTTRPAPTLSTLSVSDASATEGVAIEFTVSMSAASNQQVTVAHATQHGTATSPGDFTAASGTLTFAAGETSKTVSIATIDDLSDEEDETFSLTLSSPTNATLVDARATGTINDDDEKTDDVAVSPTLLNLVEGGDSKAYTVTLNTPPDRDVTVRIKAIGRNGELNIGSGGLGTSLTVSSDLLTFTTSNWNVPQTVTLRDEHDERATHEVIRMTHTASGGGYDTVAHRIPDVTVNTWDDDWTPVYVHKLNNPKRLPEGTQQFYLVRLNGRPGGYGPEGGVTTVTIGGWEGTSVTVSPSTFTFTGADFNFPQRAYFSIAHDSDDADETVTLTHTTSGGGYDVDYDGNPLPVTTKTIEIADDENPSTQFVSIAPPQGSVTEGNAVVFTLTRTGDVTAALTVSGGVKETGEMLSGTPNPWSVTFSAGSTTAELSLPTDNDGVAEDESEITAWVGPGYDYTYASGQSIATATVEDDETSPVLSSATVIGDRLTLTFSKFLDGNSVPGSSAFTATVDGTARSVDAVAVQDDTVTLTLASAVASGETVTVGYTAPTGANASPLQDAAGNQVAGFTDQAVTNTTTSSNAAPTGLPTISGMPVAGETLTASASDIVDADGLTNATFAWQWIASDGTSDADIAGATGSTYTLTAADVGKTLKVRATFTDDQGTEETLVSDATVAVAEIASSMSLQNAYVSGVSGPQLNLVFRWDSGQRLDANSLPAPAAFTVEVNGEVRTVSGVSFHALNAVRLTLAPAVKGGDVVQVGYTAPTGATANRLQDNSGRPVASFARVAVTNRMAAPANNPPTGLPTISGTSGVGETLTASASEIADADGLTNATFAWQWLANDTDIAGATGSTYTLTAAETGKGIKVRVSFTDDGGKWETLVSRQTSMVMPVGGLYARVSGSPGVGESLSARISGGPPIYNAQRDQFAFQWISTDGTHDFDIAGATEDDYEPIAADVGESIKVRVTFTHNDGTETTYVSAPTAAIKPAVTLSLEDVPAGHDGITRFEIKLRFSDHVYVRGVTHRLEFRGSNPPNWGVVSHDPKRTPEGDTAQDFTVWITPQHTDDIEFRFDVSRGTCLATEDICTEDKQRFREPTHTTIAGPSLGVMTRSLITAPENSTAIATLTAESGDTPTTDLVWSLVGGADADKVTLGSDGVLAFNAAKDFEAPDDSDYDGDYEITVRVSDDTDSADKPLTVRLTNIDEDGAAPDLLSATIDGSALTLRFHEPLNGASVPASSAFTVKVDGTARAVSGVSIDGYRVRLTLASSVGAGETVTVGYTTPTGADASPLQDDGGNQVASFADQSVTNESSTPTVWGSPKVEYNQLELYFSEELDGDSVPPNAAFTVKADGSPRIVYGVSIDGRKVTLKLGLAAQSSETWTVGYTVPAGANESPLQDPGGNRVASFADRAVLNNAVPNGLTLDSAEVAGSALTLTFSYLLLDSSEPAPSAFAVTVNGTARSVSSVSIGVAERGGRGEVTLTLASPVTYGDTVTVGYAVPTGANASPLRSSDNSAILVASFAGVAVTNRTVSPMTLQDTHVVGSKLNLVFSRVSGQGLDQNSLPGPEAFAVGVSGTARDVSGVSFQGLNEVILTLASPVASGDSVRVGYTVPTRADAKRLQDNAGLPVAAFAGEVVTNGTPANNAPTGLPSISGTAQVGETLTASSSGIADANGLTNVVFAWQWIANDGTSDADIAGATAETYTPTAAEAGKTLKVRATFTDDHGTEETLLSAATAQVAAALPVVSITAASSPVTEGGAASFTLSRTGDTAAELTVSVAVAEAGSVLSGTPASTVTFAAGDAEATLGVATDDDSAAEADGRVTATISAGTGYAVNSDSASAGVDVYDNDEVASTAAETLWTSTLTVQDIGGALLGYMFGNGLNPNGWSEDGAQFRVNSLHYFAQYRELSFTLSAGVSDPEQLTLHLDDLRVELSGVSGERFFYWTVEHPGWQAGQTVAVKLTRADPEAAVDAGPEISVADTQVQEAEGAVLSFPVTLAEAQTSVVTVRYATADGTATAGTDYVSVSGALRFAPGETAKTVTVPVLNDAHDEGRETLTLALSRPFGAALADGEATGTIMNTDPMPQAWLTRFGRTVGSQVVDAVTARLDNGGGSHVTVGGVSLGGSGSPPAEISDWNEWDTGRERRHVAREIGERELLLGSSFQLSSGERADGGSAFTAWGRVASDGFEGDSDDVDIDGDVTTAFIGFDAEWDRALAGLLLSQSRGEGSYVLDTELGNDRGNVESDLTGVYPYARLAMSDRVSVWGVAGIGGGELTLHQEGGTPADTDLTMRMGAVGVKGTVLDGAGRSGLGVNVKSDAMWVRTEADGAEGFESADGEVTRLRLVLEGERGFETGDGATLTPSGRVGLRHDGGDAETGIGVEMGAGIRYTTGALTVEGYVRALVAHEASGYEEWGASGAMRLRPDSSGRGLTLTLAPTWGSAASATERLWSGRDVTTALAIGDEAEAEGRLEATIGYGMPVLGGRFTGTPELGLGLSERGRDWRLGWRLGLAGSGPVAFDLGAEATRREPADGDAPENRFALTATMRW